MEKQMGNMYFLSDPSYDFKSELHDTHPLRLFVKAMMKSEHFPEELKDHFKERVFTKRSLDRHEVEEMHGGNLKDFVDKSGLRFRLLHSSIGSATYDGSGVGAMAGVFPWAKEISDLCSYIELDATFTALSPYTLCVPLAIIQNEAFPIGFVAGPTERACLFHIFAEFMTDLGITSYASKPILSDEGSGLASYASSMKVPHFLCHRHILEGLGSGTYIASLANRLLRAGTPAVYLSRAEQVYSDLNCLIKRKLLKKKSPALRKFYDLFGRDPKSVTKFQPQAMWTRNNYGVSTCSNHVERLHRQLNAAIKGLRNFARRLAIVIATLSQRFESASRFTHRQARKTLVMLSKYTGERAAECEQQCGWGAVYSARFGFRGFPCKHMFCLDPETVKWPDPPTLAINHSLYAHQIPIREDLNLALDKLRKKFPDLTRLPWVFSLSKTHVVSEIPEKDIECECDSFILELAGECLRFCPVKLDRGTLIARIAYEWAFITMGQNDILPDAKSNFRVDWWCKASDNQIPTLPI
jgi:hypothetical protein